MTAAVSSAGVTSRKARLAPRTQRSAAASWSHWAADGVRPSPQELAVARKQGVEVVGRQPPVALQRPHFGHDKVVGQLVAGVGRQRAVQGGDRAENYEECRPRGERDRRPLPASELGPEVQQGSPASGREPSHTGEPRDERGQLPDNRRVEAGRQQADPNDHDGGRPHRCGGREREHEGQPKDAAVDPGDDYGSDRDQGGREVDPAQEPHEEACGAGYWQRHRPVLPDSGRD